MCKSKEREYRAKARKELGYRSPKIKAGRTISDAKVKASRRSSVKADTRKQIREYL